MNKVNLLVAAVAIMGAQSAVAAVVDYDGPSYVGKGQIQSIFGLNDPAFQAMADSNSINFTWDVSVSFDWTCTRPRGNSANPEIVRYRSTVYHNRTVGRQIDEDPRQNPVFKTLGYYLTAAHAVETRSGPVEYTCSSGKNWTLSNQSEQVSGGLSINGVLIHGASRPR